jgi:predicted nucleic acid-binding protein
MDVILDSNVYVNDFGMIGTRFASLFDYLRKVDASLVVPRIVYDEVTARFVERLNNDTESLRKAFESYNRTYFTSRVDFRMPDVQKELEILQKRLSHQSERVKRSSSWIIIHRLMLIPTSHPSRWNTPAKLISCAITLLSEKN